MIHYEGFKCFLPGSGGSDPSSGHEGPQPSDLARAKHFTLTLDTGQHQERGDLAQYDADGEQPLTERNMKMSKHTESPNPSKVSANAYCIKTNQ